VLLIAKTTNLICVVKSLHDGSHIGNVLKAGIFAKKCKQQLKNIETK